MQQFLLLAWLLPDVIRQSAAWFAPIPRGHKLRQLQKSNQWHVQPNQVFILINIVKETLKYRSDAGKKLFSTVANTVTNLDNTCIGIHVGYETHVGNKDKETGKIDTNREVSSVYGHVWLNACQGQNLASSTLGAVVGFLDKRTQIEQRKQEQACDKELKAVQSYTAAVIKNMEGKFPGKARGEKLVHDIEGTADLTNFIIPSAIRGRMPDVGSFVPQIQIPSIPNGYGRPAPARGMR